MKISILISLISFSLIISQVFSAGFQNPVILGEDNPDPGAIFYDGAYYVVTTVINDSQPSKFPIHKSTDLQNWTYVGEIFPPDYVPKWANASSWAPEIHIINNRFTVYFVARETASGILSVGAATSDNILGPYIDIGAPLIKNTTVGSIDPTIMNIDNTTHYILWKDDGNAKNPPIPCCIWFQQLSSDGLSTTGSKSIVFCNDLPWEGNIVEAPWVIKREGWYYLFYSGFWCCNSTYAVGVARSKQPLGPYEKKGDPILKSNTEWSGPGHCSVMRDFRTIDKYVMIYHSWQAGQVCQNNYNRLLMVDFVYWTLDGWPYMKDSSPTSGNCEFLMIK